MVISLVIDHVIEGFALSATTLHPEFSLLASEQARGEHETGTRAYGPLAYLEIARGDVAGRRTWIFSITSFFAETWSKCFASARSAISERPGTGSTTER